MSRPTLYVATSNAGKLRDFALAASQASAGWSLATLPGLIAIEPPEEIGTTFEENARAKALYYAGHARGMLVLADDSGLEVAALNNAPGIYSARYAERLGYAGAPGASQDERNNACLLEQLCDVQPAGDAWGGCAAQYRCALAVARDGIVLAAAEGAIRGEILREPRGCGGFGYDPLFFRASEGRTMAELSAEQRLALNHRGIALRALLRDFEP